MTTRTTIRIRPATMFAATLPTVARIGLPLVLALLVAANAGVAHAAEKRLGVACRGPGAAATCNMISKVAKSKKYQVVGAQAIAKAAGRLHATLDENDTAGFTGVAKELGISAFVVGEVTKKKGVLTVRGGADGTVSAEGSWTGANPRKLSQAVGKTFWKRLGGAIERGQKPSGAKAPVVAEEAPAPETGADEPGDDEPKGGSKPVAAASDDSSGDDSSERSRKPSKKSKSDDEAGSETTVSEHAEPGDDASGPAGEALIVSVGPRFMARSLSYVDDIYRRNSKYNLGGAPELGINADFYPGALAGVGGIASDIGVAIDLAYLLPVVTSPAPNRVGHYSTYGLAWSAGAKIRLPMGFFGTVAYGHQRFQLIASQSGTSGIDVPMTDYGYVRIGGGGRFNVTPEVSLMVNAAYLHCLSLGQIATAAYYKKATCGAVEAGAGIGYRLGGMFELQAGAAIRRFGLAFHQNRSEFPDTVNTDPTRIAGGAVDQYLMGYVALAVVLGSGSSSGSGHAEEAAADDDTSEAKKADSDGEEEEGSSKKSKKKADDEEEESDL